MEDKIQKILRFQGLIAATFTSFRKDGSINTDIIPKYVKHLYSNGVQGVFLNGTSGESVSLSVAERKTTLEKWVQSAKGRLLIIAHIGTNCILEAKELAEHAEAHGVDAIATIPPIYYRPNNDDELLRYLAEISSAAPNTPLVYYHIPKLTGVNVTLSSFMIKAVEKVPNLCGAKYTSTDLSDLVNFQMKYGDRFKLMLGAEELLLGVLPYEVNTFIGISFSMFAPLVKDIIQSYEERDLKTALQQQYKLISSMEEIMKHGSLVPALKETMNLLTDVNVGNTRVPIFPLGKQEREALFVTLKSLGY